MHSTLYQSHLLNVAHEEHVLLSLREFYNNQKLVCNNSNSTEKQFKELERLRIQWSEQAEKVSLTHIELIAASKDEDAIQCNRLTVENESLIKENNKLKSDLANAAIRNNSQQFATNNLLQNLKQAVTKISAYVKITCITPTELEIVECELLPSKKQPIEPTIDDSKKPVIDLFKSQFDAIQELKQVKNK